MVIALVAGLVPFIRHGHLGDCLYLDLADDRWRAIQIDAKGWKIIDQAPVKFIRSDRMLSLPDPVRPLPSETGSGALI